MLADILKVSREKLLARSEASLTENQLHSFVRAKLRLSRGVPLGYVLGYQWFYGLKFKVDRSVLIPRPETEQLVDLGASAVRSHKLHTVVDVATGSGAIAVALAHALAAKHVQCTYIASDVSEPALKIAKKNAAANGTKVKFYRGNLLAGLASKLPREKMLITANLPYLTAAEMREPSIAREPKLALLGSGRNGAGLIVELLRQIGKLGLSNSTVLLEIGYRQAAAISAAAEREIKDCKVAVHKDLAGFDRVLEITIA